MKLTILALAILSALAAPAFAGQTCHTDCHQSYVGSGSSCTTTCD